MGDEGRSLSEVEHVSDRHWRIPILLSKMSSSINFVMFISHHPVDPPSTRKSVPVTYELASASRNTTAPRYSSGEEILLSMASCSHTAVHSLRESTSLVIGVWMTPGLMEFTRMAGDAEDGDGDGDGEEPHSPARERVS